MRKILLLILFSSFFARAALAQEPSVTPGTRTPAPTATLTPSRTPSITPTIPPTPVPTLEGFAMDSSGEVLFPEAVRFAFSLSRPLVDLDMDSLTLTIDTAAAAPAMLELDIAALDVGGTDHTHLEYIWDIPEDEVPPLFSEITFGWQIAARDGELAHAEGSVVYADQRVVWTTGREANGSFVVAAARELGAGLPRTLLPIYELLAENTNTRPEMGLMIYNERVAPGCAFRQNESGAAEAISVAPFSNVTVPCSPEFAERVYEQSGYTVLQRLPGMDVETLSAAVMTRLFYAPLWEGSEVPLWFAAGLEQLYSPSLKSELLPVIQDAARTRRLFPLDSMNLPPPNDAQQAQIWYGQSYGMLLYMVEQAGYEGVYELARAISSGEPFVNLYAEIIGEPLNALIASMQGWIFSERAVSVYGITAYQPATPTFTPTLTPSITPTPTLTPTFTPTVTPSVTGVLSSTPYPTVTVTRTPTPAPPTITPRPPMTPAPAPGSTINTPFTSNVQIAVVAGLLIVIAVLVYVYIRTGRR